MTCSLVSPRSRSGFNCTVNWPRFSAENPELTPTVDPTVSTAGSDRIASTTRSCRADMAENETDGSATVLPWSSPVSWIGKKPFGISRYRKTVPIAQPSVSSSISRRHRNAESNVRA